MKNKYFDKLNEVQGKYGQLLKDTMAECRYKIVEAGEIYNSKAVRKKQEEILKAYQKKINDIQNQYINDVEKMVQHEQLMIQATQDNKPKDNVTRLIEAMELNNKIQMNQIKMATMNETELFALLDNQQDEIIFNLAKAQIFKMAENVDNGGELKQKARMANLVTQESMLNEVIASVRMDIANKDMLLPGMSLADAMIVNNKGGINAFLSQDMEPVKEGDVK